MTELFDAMRSLKSRHELEIFMRDLCTLGELEAMAHRWHAARLVDEGGVDRDRHSGGPLAEPRRGRLPARARQGEEGNRLTIAVPVKGRLRDQSVLLLEDAGL